VAAGIDALGARAAERICGRKSALGMSSPRCPIRRLRGSRWRPCAAAN